MRLNEHAMNKLIRTQSLRRVINRATQSSGRGIKGVPWAEVLCHAHKQGSQI